MPLYASLRTRKLKTNYKMRSCDRHNRRLYQPKNLVPHPKYANKRMVGHAYESVRQAVTRRIKETGAKPAKNSVLAQEIVLYASPEYFRPQYHRKDPDGFGKFDDKPTAQWANATKNWLVEKYGDNLVSVDLHLDESTPHIHAVVTPIMEKTLKKKRTKEQIKNNEPAETYTAKRFDADTMFGWKQHDSFQAEYAGALKHLGLVPGVKKDRSKAEHETHHEYNQKLKEALNEPEFKNADEYEEFVPRKRKFFESAGNYLSSIFDGFKALHAKNQQKLNQIVYQSESKRQVLSHDNQQMSEKVKKYQDTLDFMDKYDINPDDLLDFVHHRDSQAKEQRLQARQSNTLPSPTYQP